MVPATVSDDVDVEPWIDGGDVTARIVRAIIAACSLRNRRSMLGMMSERQSRRLHESVHLGIAVDTKDGLFVPVLRDAGTP